MNAQSSVSGIVASSRQALSDAAPALLLYVAARAVGLAVLAAWAAIAGRDAHHLLVSWDSRWYEGIANHGYGFVRIHQDGRLLSDVAFFPLFPWLERVASRVTGLPTVDAGLAISWAASLVAAWGIFAIGAHVHNRRVGVVLVVLWAALPVGIVTSMAYSESLFTALAAWSLYAVLTRHWVHAGALASLAGLTRPVGVAVVAAVVLPAVLLLLRRTPPTWGARADHARNSNWPVLIGALLAPLGWLGYIGSVGVATGNPLGYFEAAGRWGNSFDGGWAFALWIWAFLGSSAFLLGVAVCLGVAMLIWLFVLCVREAVPPPLLIFCGVLIFLALTTSGYFGSKPRYLLPAFPLLLPVAAALSRLQLRFAAIVLVLMTAGSAIYGAFWLHGPGPP